jgi:hypothetical protein
LNNSLQIKRIDPAAAIPGGEVAVEYTKSAGAEGPLNIRFASSPAHITASDGGRALVLVPKISAGGPVPVSAIAGSESEPDVVRSEFLIGRELADGLHPVANPAVDPRDGSIFVTRSGSRGEHMPISIFQIKPDGDVDEFSGDIMNPTGIAFGGAGRMYVTSRFDGSVYRITELREPITFAEEMGTATGLAFNRAGEMFVGDRGGTIYRVNEIGIPKAWAHHEASVSAYHLAFGPDDYLYLTGPTASSHEEVTRFDEEGRSSTFFRGLGRPQGLAFDQAGNLYVAASLRGRRGIVRISADGKAAELLVAGMNIVGLAFTRDGEMIVATNEAVYSLAIGIRGLLPN